MGWSKAAEKGADAVSKVSQGVTDRAKIKDAGNKGQRTLNELDAKQGGFFRAGWRPTLCWTVTIMFIWNHGVGDIVGQIVNGYEFTQLGDDVADNLVWVLLGLGTVRTAEKKMGPLSRMFRRQ